MILVTGGNGFLGSEVCKKLDLKGLEYYSFKSSDYDLTNQEQTKQLFKKIKPKTVIHISARLGGVKDNVDNPFFYFKDNLAMGMNVVNNCCEFRIKNLININTVCSYPLNEKQPFKEATINNGLPNKSNLYYGIAKRTILNYSEIASKTYGFELSNLILTNLFGINDDFNEQTSHVVPALITKITESKKVGKSLIVWGHQNVTRDFITSEYASEIIMKTYELGSGVGRMNVGSGKSYSIGDIVKFLCDLYDFSGHVVYETNSPTGQPKRSLNVDYLNDTFGNSDHGSKFYQELEKVCLWYMENEEEIIEKNKKLKFGCLKYY